MTRRFLTLPALLLALAFLISGPAASAGQPAQKIADINYNEDELGPNMTTLNSLDLYLPEVPDNARVGLRPLIVWVHGGGLVTGDKSNRMPDKVRLFNDLGYIVASVNYRLSPDCCDFDPARVRAPDHISDLAEAVGWLSRNIGNYGGDPDRIVLIGHSAGAHLVSLAGASPAWIEGRKVSRKQIIGVVSLDTDNFDIRKEASNDTPLNRRLSAWNAFGTPGEELVEPRWERMSPVVHADPTDPDFLLVTSLNPVRLSANQEMATALGQDPATSVLGVPLDHEGINTSLGSPGDTTEETTRVSQFIQGLIASARPAGVKVIRRPSKRVVVKVSRRAGKQTIRKVRRKVTFAFKGTGRASGFQCRIDRQKYSACRSPRNSRLKPGSHTFRVRALYPSGRPGNERKVTFRIVTKRANR
ncbi:MAG: Alpha/beta hydrolase [Actinomycetota bacterium]|jgi:acetyl esterase/lipase|nr:Alpha/beta hydrolase [Actinomycetota bacterium]